MGLTTRSSPSGYWRAGARLALSPNLSDSDGVKYVWSPAAFAVLCIRSDANAFTSVSIFKEHSGLAGQPLAPSY